MNGKTSIVREYLKKTYSRWLFVAAFLLAVILVAIAGLTFRLDNTKLIFGEPEKFNSGWYTYDKNGDGLKLEEITRKEAGATDRTLVLYNDIPSDLDSDSALFFTTKNERVRAYAGDGLIYEYGYNDSTSYGWEFGAVHLIIPLGEENEGKVLRLELEPIAGRTGESGYEFLLGSKDTLVASELKNDSFTIIVCVILLVFSLGYLINYVVCSVTKGEKPLVYLYFGMFVLLAALWAIADGLVLQFAFTNKSVSYMIFNTSFYLMPIPIALFMGEVLSAKKRLFNIFAVSGTLYFLVRISLYLAGVMNFETALFIVHLIMVAQMVTAFIALLTPLLKKEKLTNKILMLAVAEMLVFEFIPLISFYAFNKLDVLRYGYSSGFYYGIIIFIIIIAVGNAVKNREERKSMHRAGYFEHEAYHDEKTGLLNKKGIEDLAAETMAKRRGKVYAAIDFDINGFAQYNAINGFEAGDMLIMKISAILQNLCRGGELCARAGADHFIVLVFGNDLKMIYDRVIMADTQFNLSHKSGQVMISYGISKVEKHDKESFITAREQAMEAKRSVKGRFEKNVALFNREIHEKRIRATKLIGSFDSDLKGDRYTMYLQPRFNIRTGKIDGAESLSRRITEDGSIMSPGEYIPFLEENGLVSKLDIKIYTDVCRMLESCAINKRPMHPVAVNFSRFHIYNPTFVDEIAYIAKCFHVPCELLEIEITESAFDVKQISQFREMIRKLHSYGFKVMVDDFGSGYSSLNMLKDLDIDVIKIDREFITDLENDERACTIVKNIMRLTSELDIGVIAEGIEREEQIGLLLDYGCDIAQGYYYSEPISYEEYMIKYL